MSEDCRWRGPYFHRSSEPDRILRSRGPSPPTPLTVPDRRGRRRDRDSDRSVPSGTLRPGVTKTCIPSETSVRVSIFTWVKVLVFVFGQQTHYENVVSTTGKDADIKHRNSNIFRCDLRLCSRKTCGGSRGETFGPEVLRQTKEKKEKKPLSKS